MHAFYSFFGDEVIGVAEGYINVDPSGGSRNKERGRRTQQISLIIHNNTPFRAFSAFFGQ